MDYNRNKGGRGLKASPHMEARKMITNKAGTKISFYLDKNCDSCKKVIAEIQKHLSEYEGCIETEPSSNSFKVLKPTEPKVYGSVIQQGENKGKHLELVLVPEFNAYGHLTTWHIKKLCVIRGL